MAKGRKTGINDQQKRFCEEYLIDLNGKQAALRAGYSETSAKEIGSILLSKEPVKQYIDQLLEEHKAQLGITTAEVIDGIKSIAFSPDAPTGVKLQALKTLGEYLQLFNQNTKVDMNLTGGLVIVDDIGVGKNDTD